MKERQYVITIPSNHLSRCHIVEDNSHSSDIIYPVHFVGIYNAKSKNEAIHIASEDSGYAENILDAKNVRAKKVVSKLCKGQMSLDDFL